MDTRLAEWGSRFLLVLALFALPSTPALAEWHRAESDRFVIYSNSRPDDLKEFGQMLERFHAAMALESGRDIPVPSPSSRLTVYMVGSRDNLSKIYGPGGANVGGFYIARAEGSVTFVPNIKIGGQDAGRGTTGTRRNRSSNQGAVSGTLSILLHEYAHHFLIGSSRHAMPRWLSEGAAEYFSAARFNGDGSVDIGLPNNERAYEISQAAQVPLDELLDYELYLKNRSSRYDAFYGRSWLLYHYLRFSPNRSGQLAQYWQAVASGEKSIEAAERIFGNLEELSDEVKAYGRKRNMAGMRFASGDVRIGAVNVEKLSKGHAAMMGVILRSKRGLRESQTQDVLRDSRAIAANYPDDAAVLSALAEAEYDAGNDAEAIAAADRAIAANRQTKSAYVQKGYALFRLARDADDAGKADAFAKAMKPFEALNALETDHTQPLIYYYRSFTQRGVTPPEGARLALERATQLAPFDKRLAMEVAAMKMAEGDPVIAHYLLAPVAANPHGGRQSRLARAVMQVLENAPEGKPLSFQKIRKRWEEANANRTDNVDD